jgi:hypothetical protein
MPEEELTPPEKEYPENPAPPPLPESPPEGLRECESESLPSQETAESVVEESRVRGPGAPRGNQNARKHGFYSSRVSRREQYDLSEASEVHGITEEMALLRVRIKIIQETCPDDHELMIRAMAALSRMVRQQGI